MCQFPAAQLLQLRRNIGRNMPPRSDIQSPITWALGDDLTQAIDQMWKDHHDATGCQCWHEARSRAAQGLPPAGTMTSAPAENSSARLPRNVTPASIRAVPRVPGQPVSASSSRTNGFRGQKSATS